MSGGDARRAAFDEWLAKGLIDAAQHASMCLALGPLVQADVRGSGAIAQGDGAQAGGERALVVGPGNKGPVHQDNSTHLHVGPAGTSPAALRRAYLRRVWKQTDSLALLTGGDVRSPVRLGAVYTALLTARMTSDASSSPLPPSGDGGQFHRER